MNPPKRFRKYTAERGDAFKASDFIDTVTVPPVSDVLENGTIASRRRNRNARAKYIRLTVVQPDDARTTKKYYDNKQRVGSRYCTTNSGVVRIYS
jgi:hypothetical protein